MMFLERWMLTAAANGILVVLYGAIAVTMIREAARGRQWTSNPLLTATIAIFSACAIGHGLHMAHALLAPLAAGHAHQAALGFATRTAFSDWRLLVWDGLTALVAIWYWGLRARFAVLFHGAGLCEDMAKRQQQAMDLHDNVVQGLVQAKLALDLGRREEGRKAVADTLEAAQGIVSRVLGERGKDLFPLGLGT